MPSTPSDRPLGQTDGPLKRADQALARRGFTTGRLRLRAAAVLVAITAAVSGALLYGLTNVLGPDAVCGGAVSADALHDALGPGRISEEDNGGSTAFQGNASSCTATVGSGFLGQSRRSVQVGLRSDLDTAVSEADPAARLFGAAANGGSSGGSTGARAWAILPEACGGGLHTRVSMTRDDSVGDAGLARLAVAAANGIAAQRDCAQSRLPAPKVLSAAGTRQDLAAGEVCGLPGLAVPGGPSAARGYKQQASTAFDPLWACEVGLGENSTAAVLTIGTEPRLRAPNLDKDTPVAFGRAHWTMGHSFPNNDEVVVTCQGRPAYFKLRLLGDRTLFPDTAELWKQFLTAGGKAVGCEPILP
ncbi:hypothetical protein ACGFZP_03550 [Kitasatospora sp. NPDC048239]|uniref:hypothetical protein n=1 Tax=Kitasatospora sp. NPDC048239 TaxID=3364046 RepID=UPI00371451EA